MNTVACATLVEVQNHLIGKTPTEKERTGNIENHSETGQNGLKIGEKTFNNKQLNK